MWMMYINDARRLPHKVLANGRLEVQVAGVTLRETRRIESGPAKILTFKIWIPAGSRRCHAEEIVIWAAQVTAALSARGFTT